jgi:hypothetical protein
MLSYADEEPPLIAKAFILFWEAILVAVALTLLACLIGLAGERMDEQRRHEQALRASDATRKRGEAFLAREQWVRDEMAKNHGVAK